MSLPKWAESESIELHEAEQQQSNAEIAEYIQKQKDRIKELEAVKPDFGVFVALAEKWLDPTTPRLTYRECADELLAAVKKMEECK